MLNEKSFIHSGDTVQLFHKELGGFLTVSEKEVDKYLPKFPDFLQRQINFMEHDIIDDKKDDEDDIEEEGPRLNFRIYI